MSSVASVIIPAYDVETTIGRTLESVLAQDFDGEVEVIVVDNGSTDETASIVGRYPVRCVREARRGRSAARNRGAAEARGDFLAFADADCELPRSWLTQSLSALERPWIGAAQARICKHRGRAPAEDFVHARYYLPFLDTCALVTTRRAFDDARGFDEVLRRNVDMDFSFRLLACGYALALVPDAIAIKHHDLTQRQAIRRGWDGGLSASLVDKRWAPRVPRAATRRLDALKGWTRQALLQRPSLGAARALAVLEQTSKLAGYAYAELAHSRLAPSRYEAVTDLPRVLGGRRSLVLYSGEALLFDAGQRRRHHLDRLRAHAVTCFIDGVSDPDVIGRRLVERFGVSAEAARAGVDAATRLLSD